MFKNHFGETVTVVLAIIMGLIMAFAVIVIDHLAINFSTVFQIWSMITLVILLVSIVIPYKSWSAHFTVLLHLQDGSVAHRMVDNILPSLILNTFKRSWMMMCSSSGCPPLTRRRFFGGARPTSPRIRPLCGSPGSSWANTTASSAGAASSPTASRAEPLHTAAG